MATAAAAADDEAEAEGGSARGAAAWPPSRPRPVALVGVTASGKSAAALEVARAAARAGVAVELVSVDSMAVYRGMDVGTDTPSPSVRREVPYHLLDLVDPAEEFSVREFQAAASDAVEGITGRGRRPVLVGGTGLYLRAVTDGLAFPGRFPAVAAELAGSLDAAGPCGSVARRRRL
ncbi:MAG TPA: tRNA dimethylallyltransferase, partial [Acidimicrobiales bacterium]|nr:tRNA dimethylallyltransferase [Acidimicrobiales bacterium]